MAADLNRARKKFRRFGTRKKRLLPTEALDYKNLGYLQTMLTPQGRMMSRKRTGFSGIHQKQLKLAVKRARFIGLLPYVG